MNDGTVSDGVSRVIRFCDDVRNETKAFSLGITGRLDVLGYISWSSGTE